MFCYHCGCRLSEHDFCTACRTDVRIYKKIMMSSNRLYNEGLEKAQIRDLSGAIVSLKESIKFNKLHTDARNLLGLVYYEMGEVVAALGEWVISKNLRSDKNIASDYIEMIQHSGTRLDAINQTIKKYNQALTYCRQGSKDLAIIQLKKVLSLNPNFIRAHLLLALLYIDSATWDRAAREVSRSLDIDHNNLMALRYRREIDQVSNLEEEAGSSVNRKEKKALRYRSDNELIITPMNVKEPKHGGAVTILNIVLGLVIGVLAACFLILPTAVTNTRNDAEAENAKIYNEMDLKTARITELEQAAIKDREQIAQLEEAISQLKIDQTKADEIDTLLNAAVTYLTTADVLETDAQLTIARQSIDFEQASDSANQLYDSLVLAIGEEVSVALYEQGRELYDEDDYVQALSVLQRACEYNAENWDALYYLGHAYRMNEDYANARLCYEAFVTALPRTERASRAREHLQNMPQTTP